jgi:hypothetical protein
MAVLNGGSIGPKVDAYLARCLVGSIHTVDNERLLGQLKKLPANDMTSSSRTFAMMYKGETSFDDAKRRTHATKFYAETRSKQALASRADRIKYDREGYYEDLQVHLSIALAREARDVEKQVGLFLMLL